MMYKRLCVSVFCSLCLLLLWSCEAPVNSNEENQSVLSSELNMSSSTQQSILESILNKTKTYGKLIDSRDGKEYKTIQIGRQTWMAQNLNYGTKASLLAYNSIQNYGQKLCRGNADSCAIYGGQYQWHVAMNLDNQCSGETCASLIKSTHQGICPSEWHLPTMAELDTLLSNVGGFQNINQLLGNLNTSSTWDSIATNQSGMTLVPSGWSGSGVAGGGSVYLWTVNEKNANQAFPWAYIEGSKSGIQKYETPKTFALAVRCVKNEVQF